LNFYRLLLSQCLIVFDCNLFLQFILMRKDIFGIYAHFFQHLGQSQIYFMLMKRISLITTISWFVVFDLFNRLKETLNTFIAAYNIRLLFNYFLSIYCALNFAWFISLAYLPVKLIAIFYYLHLFTDLDLLLSDHLEYFVQLFTILSYLVLNVFIRKGLLDLTNLEGTLTKELFIFVLKVNWIHLNRRFFFNIRMAS
jgi:hypothetical protein